MKLILNKSNGSFLFSREIMNDLGIELSAQARNYRQNADLIHAVETMGQRAAGNGSYLEVVELPEAATDFAILNDDGLENVVYVEDGKLHWK